MLSLGGGPGGDFAALATLADYAGGDYLDNRPAPTRHQRPSARVHCDVVDYEAGWAACVAHLVDTLCSRRLGTRAAPARIVCHARGARGVPADQCRRPGRLRATKDQPGRSNGRVRAACEDRQGLPSSSDGSLRGPAALIVRWTCAQGPCRWRTLGRQGPEKVRAARCGCAKTNRIFVSCVSCVCGVGFPPARCALVSRRRF